VSSSSGASASEVQPAQLIYAPEDGCLATVEFAYGPRAAPPAITWHGRNVDNFIQVYLQLAASAATARRAERLPAYSINIRRVHTWNLHISRDANKTSYIYTCIFISRGSCPIPLYIDIHLNMHLAQSSMQLKHDREYILAILLVLDTFGYKRKYIIYNEHVWNLSTLWSTYNTYTLSHTCILYTHAVYANRHIRHLTRLFFHSSYILK